MSCVCCRCHTPECPIDMCRMAHLYVWHDSYIHTHVIAAVSIVQYTRLICVKRLIHTCDMTHSHVWHDWFIHVTWLIHSSIRVTWLIHTCEWVILHIWVMWIHESCHTYEWVMSYVWTSHFTHERVTSCIWMSHVARMNESCDTYQSGTLAYANGNKRTSHVACMNESCRTYEWVMSHISTGHTGLCQRQQIRWRLG